MGLSGSYGPATPEDGLKAIRHALDRGVTLFSTASFYGGGENEKLLGRALAGPTSAMVATKFGVRSDARGLPTVIDGRPEYVRQACDEALVRLGRDVIDLFILARVDPRVPIEQSIDAMAGLVSAGKVRGIGLSEASAEMIVRAHAVHPLSVVETEYSLLDRHVEIKILPQLTRLGIALLAYSPLGRGFLSAAMPNASAMSPRDLRQHAPRFQGSNLDANLKLLPSLCSLAQNKGATPAQIALAWLLAKGAGVIPLPGSRSPSRIDENLAALQLRLNDAELAELDGAFVVGSVAGARYPEALMAAIEADSPLP